MVARVLCGVDPLPSSPSPSSSSSPLPSFSSPPLSSRRCRRSANIITITTKSKTTANSTTSQMLLPRTFVTSVRNIPPPPRAVLQCSANDDDDDDDNTKLGFSGRVRRQCRPLLSPPQLRPPLLPLHIILIVFTLLPNLLVPFSNLAVHCDPLPSLTSSSSPSSPSSSSSSPQSSAEAPSLVSATAAALSAPPPSAAALYAASSVNFRCPEQFGYYADEYNCSKYFVCVFGEALHESCTGGLRFSSELQTCDWPRNVVCPSEDLDSSYDDDGEEGDSSSSGGSSSSSGGHHQQSSHSKSVGSGIVQELTTSRSGLLLDGYVKEAKNAAVINVGKSQQQQQQQQQSPSAGGVNHAHIVINSHHHHNHQRGVTNLPVTTTPSPSQTTFTTEDHSSSSENINEAALQESFDKLARHSSSSSRHRGKASSGPSMQYDLVKNNAADGGGVHHHHHHQQHHSYIDLTSSVPHDINSNKLDNNGSGGGGSGTGGDGDLRGDELDENFTLVDLQRSRISLDGGKTFRGHQSGSTGKSGSSTNYNDNILGRSVNGANRAQSVSVVASTSSEAMLPELDFVFKQTSNNKQQSSSTGNLQNSRGLNDRATRISSSLDQDTSGLDHHLTRSADHDDDHDGADHLNDDGHQSRSKDFDEALAAIVDENGAIHLDGEDGPTLLRIIANTPLVQQQQHKPKKISSIPPPFNGQNSLPGTAASNRNTASQQMILSKTTPTTTNLDDKTHHFGSSQQRPQVGGSGGGKSSASIPDTDSLDIKTLKTGAGTILVFNRTQLITVSTGGDGGEGSGSGAGKGNGSSTFILIDHQQPTATVQDGRQSLLSAYEAAEQAAKQQQNHRPRQPIIIRTEKSEEPVGGGGAASRGRSFGSSSASSASANKTTITGQLLGSKERSLKPVNKQQQQQQQQSGASAILTDEEDIADLLVELAGPPPSSVDEDVVEEAFNTDFQRLTKGARGTAAVSTVAAAAAGSNSTIKSSPPTDHITLRGGHSKYQKVSNSSSSSSSSQASNSTHPIVIHNRGSHARHLGSHQRGSQKSSGSSSRGSNRFANVTLQTPARPASVFSTPEPLSTATKCSEEVCRLPDCFCGGTEIPGGLPVKDVPQLVVISFDDAVNDINWHIFEELLNSGRSNPNGCPIKSTFYCSHEWTDYSLVQTLYSRGHEIASHSITHSFGERFTKQQWEKEIAGQREILHLYGGVNKADVRGMRAAFLQGGGNKQFEMLFEQNFTYDSSMPVFENQPPFWPYTLDYAINHECMIAPCPTKAYPGLWSIGLVMWQDLNGGRCSMGDACTNPSNEDGVYEMIMKNFKRHYNSNRAPFGLYYHSAWFNSEHHRRGFLRVIDDLLTYYKDVYFVTKWELLQWIRNPTPLKELYRVNLFGCARDPHRPSPCLHPNICNVEHPQSGQSRFLKTCQPCPKRYPWLGDSGQK